MSPRRLLPPSLTTRLTDSVTAAALGFTTNFHRLTTTDRANAAVGFLLTFILLVARLILSVGHNSSYRLGENKIRMKRTCFWRVLKKGGMLLAEIHFGPLRPQKQSFSTTFRQIKAHHHDCKKGVNYAKNPSI